MTIGVWYRIWQEGSDQIYYVKPYKAFSAYAYWCMMYDPSIEEPFKTIINGLYWDNVVELSSLEKELM